ncbi:MAG: Holliday junction helicase RuvA, holliday junction helicase RuvA [Candidatus Taylorbacteria bacterium]|nr:Holliday junction helicase RuvA, holliday junction helicase RuvA [Candidatus Taylorbacteria bacterium]
MISQIIGTVSHIDLKFLVVNTGAIGTNGVITAGVGYKVFATGDTIASYTVGVPASLWTHLAVRDDALDLYGFSSLQELNFFQLLTTVSGIGPKTALGILNVSSVATLHMAIETEDASHLTKVSGIGKKNAEKIVRELKDKIGDFDLIAHSAEYTATRQANIRGDSDVLAALQALGYRDNEARDAMKQIDKKLTDTGARVKAALKILGI